MASSKHGVFGDADVIVLDTAAFLLMENPGTLGAQLYTCKDVINEIRNRKARERYDRRLYELNFVEPADQDVLAVSEFAKKTGDYTQMSAVDMKVMAIAHMLEREHNGDKNLNKDPKPRVRVQRRVELGGKQTQKGMYDPRAGTAKLGTLAHDDDCAFPVPTTHKPFDRALFFRSSDARVYDDALASGSESSASAPGAAPVDDGDSDSDDDDDATAVTEVDAVDTADGVGIYDMDSDEDDGEGWIDNTNIDDNDLVVFDTDQAAPDADAGLVADTATGDAGKSGASADAAAAPVSWKAMVVNNKKDAKQGPKRVGCITTDFTMQNTMIQMGLNIVSIQGYRIRQVESFVNYCFTCGATQTDMTRQFCRSCGYATLLRVAVSINEDGTFRYHSKKDKQINTRGTKFSIPTPKGGRNPNNLIYREDQRELNTFLQPKKQHRAELFDPEFVGGGKAWHTANGARTRTVGHGHKNPNAGTRKRGHRKK